MSAPSLSPTFGVGASAIFTSRGKPNHSIISLKQSRTTCGPEWKFERVDGPDGTIYLPHRPVNPLDPVNPPESPDDLPLTAADPFIPEEIRTYIKEQQTAYSKDPEKWYLKDVKHHDTDAGESRGPTAEGVPTEDRAHINFVAPRAERSWWSLGSQAE
jgi:hypothetical protein